MRPGRRSARLVAIAMLGSVLFNFPLLALFNRPDTVWGIPMLYAWIFGAWTALIALMAVAVERDD